MKNKKHDKLVKDYVNQKNKHLENLATKMLDQQDKLEKLKNKKTKGNFLKLF